MSQTYNIRPNANKKFQVAKVEALVKNLVNTECSRIDYNEEMATAFSERLSVKIIEKLRELEFGTYKYIVNVILGEKRGSGIQGTSKCFYDSDLDSFYTYTFTSSNIFCIATVYAIYYY